MSHIVEDDSERQNWRKDHETNHVDAKEMIALMKDMLERMPERKAG